MILKPLTNGKVSGTGTLNLGFGDILGGVLITTDGANQATVAIHKDDSNGEKVVDVATVGAMWIVGPIEAAETIYYSATGTGVSIQVFEWVE